MGLFDMNPEKKNQIALQNIVMNVNENKLQVSPDFLEKMTNLYISRRMTKINELIESFSKLKNIAVIINRYEAVNSVIDELILIEPYHMFKNPVPSKFKEDLKHNLDNMINNLITKEVRVIKTKYERKDPKLMVENVKFFLDGFKPFSSYYSEATLHRIEDLRIAICGDEENAEEAIEENITDEMLSEAEDGFMPEQFETFTSDELEDKEPVL